MGLDLDYQLGNFHYPRCCVWISGSRFLASGILFFGNWLSIFASEGCFCASGEASFDLWDSTLALPLSVIFYLRTSSALVTTRTEASPSLRRALFTSWHGRPPFTGPPGRSYATPNSLKKKGIVRMLIYQSYRDGRLSYGYILKGGRKIGKS